MTKEDIYKIWAPAEALWAPWVKPVLFSFMNRTFTKSSAINIPVDANWIPIPKETALLIDLPGQEAVDWGIQVARFGYRPIPLFNALPFPVNEILSSGSKSISTVDVEPILAALYRSSEMLKEISLLPEAPPAFLLDADRRLARVDPLPGVFDNRSVCFTTDFPTPEFLLNHGIRAAILVQKDPVPGHDLLETLLRWQQGGIKLLHKDPRDSDPAKSWVVKKPSFIRSFWHRLGVLFGLRRGELGFGRIVPYSSG